MDTVLERNICFVDTSGYSQGSTSKEDMSMVVDYVESLLYQTSSVTTLEDSDALGVVSGSGGVLVDVVIYLLPPSKSNESLASCYTDIKQTKTSPRTSSTCSDCHLSPMSSPLSQNPIHSLHKKQ
jgi:hypothetical protein